MSVAEVCVCVCVCACECACACACVCVCVCVRLWLWEMSHLVICECLHLCLVEVWVRGDCVEGAKEAAREWFGRPYAVDQGGCCLPSYNAAVTLHRLPP